MAGLGFIGAGNMAEAIITGILKQGLYQPTDIYAFDISAERCSLIRERHGIKTAASVPEMLDHVDAVLLAVKPDTVTKVLSANREALAARLVISIAAGVTIDTMLAELNPQARVVRVMPNTPAMVLESASCISPSTACQADDISTAKAIFDAVGLCIQLDESLLNAVTALSGSGPAYCFLFMEALADGGVRAGLPRDTALKLAAATMKGSAELFLQQGTHPGQLKDMVSSPAGTTIAGIAALEERGFRSAAIEAVTAAFKRAQELSQK